MNIGRFNLDQDVLVVAEIGNNHEGSYARAEELIGLAAEAGAGAVKFQTFTAEHYVSSSDKERFAMLKSFELSHAQFEKLSGYAASAGVLFFSTPFDIESARFLNTIAPVFKISSGDNTFFPLLETVAGFGKPIIMSAGLADMATLRRSMKFIERIWRNAGLSQELAVLHCVTSYPAPPEQLNLAVIRLLKRELGCTVGYSDHALGIEAAALSVALGARIVEKHFTINKQAASLRDHQLSADPRDMKRLVGRIREILTIMGDESKNRMSCEKPFQTSARRSIAAVRDMASGSRLQQGDITWVRPGGGIPPGSESTVLGKMLKRDVACGERITPECLAEDQ